METKLAAIGREIGVFREAEILYNPRLTILVRTKRPREVLSRKDLTLCGVEPTEITVSWHSRASMRQHKRGERRPISAGAPEIGAIRNSSVIDATQRQKRKQ